MCGPPQKAQSRNAGVKWPSSAPPGISVCSSCDDDARIRGRHL
eukprot:CAMPEP_0115477242 /NCGR_PEP_ID=MMETSP0271-20121206/55568_1 /TAXON_ID=71861 /ORGANISM="Scrippsiella trochoidea, Strain CCMP3099" /LENGTH=42 /DNA_ID= /DNA_START= /DNA_END= /DNA_ORIENTATION=